jgi:hypothetical protein
LATFDRFRDGTQLVYRALLSRIRLHPIDSLRGYYLCKSHG